MPTLSSLLREGAVIVRRCWRTIGAIVLIVWVPLVLLLEAHPSARGDDLKAVLTQLRLYRSASIFLGVFSTMAIMYMVQAYRAGSLPTARECFGEVAHRWGSSVWMHTIQGLLLLVSLATLVVPFIYVGCAT